MRETDKGNWYPNTQSFSEEHKKKSLTVEELERMQKEQNTLQKRMGDFDLRK
jgi:hypothetical protein